MQVGAEVFAKALPNRFDLVFAEQPVVDEDARQLGADGLEQERGDDRGIDPARESADDAPVSDAFANEGDLLVDERTHLPGPLAAADLADEVPQQLAPKGSVGDFGVELETEDGAGLVLDGGGGAVGGLGENPPVFGGAADLVAMAHPDGQFFTHSVEQGGAVFDVALGAAEFAMVPGRDLDAQRLAGRLHAVADAQDGNAQFEDAGVGGGGSSFVDAGRPPREDQPLGGEFTDAGDREIVTDDLAEDILFADSPGDELGGLRTEVEHQDPLAGGLDGGGDRSFRW